MEYILSFVREVVPIIFLGIMSTFGYPYIPDESQTTTITTTTARVVQVIDGDTIDVVRDGETNPVRLRYIGIDTPEPYAENIPECGSAEASARNQALVAGKTISIVLGTDPYDQYGRLLAYVYSGDTFVNEQLITEGYATVLMIPPNTEYETTFTNLYRAAKAAKVGIWAACK
jgi:micrococcal nuclease